MILIETNGSVYGQLWFLSYMQLTTKFRSGFCARFLYQLISAAVGLCWYKSSWVIQTHVFRRCCSVQCSSVMFSSSPQWPCIATGPWAPPSPPPGAPSPFILARCVAFITWLSYTERFGCSAYNVEAVWPSVTTCAQIKHFGLCKQSSGR